MDDIEGQLRQYGRAIVRLVEADSPSGPPAARTDRSPARSPRWRAVVAAAAALVIGASVVAVLGARDDTVQVETAGRTTSTIGSTPSTSPLPDLGSSPHLLVTAPGWAVDSIREEADGGEMDLIDGAQHLELWWAPVEAYGSYVEDRRNGADREKPMVVDGHEGILFTDTDEPEQFDVLWPAGGYFFELRGGPFASEEEFRAVAATVRKVDDATWRAAMPDGSQLPGDTASRRSIIDETLADVPVPPSLDIGVLADEGSDLVVSPYDVSLSALQAVACGWIDQWLAARASGDDAARTVAATAMASSTGWEALLELDPGAEDPNVFGYADVFWDYGSAMAADRAELASGSSIASNYRHDFSCDAGAATG